MQETKALKKNSAVRAKRKKSSSYRKKRVADETSPPILNSPIKKILKALSNIRTKNNTVLARKSSEKIEQKKDIKPVKNRKKFYSSQPKKASLAIDSKKRERKKGKKLPPVDGALIRLERKIGYTFSNRDYLTLALTHPSYAHLKHIESYQRLEFLGDAVLSAIVAIQLYKNYPSKDEAFLTDLKAGYVNRHFLQEVGEKLELDKAIKGIGLSEYRLDQGIESLIGAIFLDNGFEAAERFIKKYILSRKIKPLLDPKNLLKSLALRRCHGKISFSLINESGPPHKKTFHVEARIEGVNLTGKGKGPSKKEAEGKAAEDLLQKLPREK